MNQILADNVCSLRTARSWTQEALAAAADITVRTVQRVEAAMGASSETLLAIAGALDVDADLLRSDAVGLVARELGVPRDALTPQLLEAKREELALTHAKLPMVRVAASSGLRPLADALAMAFECLSTNDEVQDVAAELQRALGELLDIGSEIDAVTRRACEREAFETVERLGKLGAIVTIGLHHHRMVLAAGDPVPWRTLYVIVAKEHEPKEFLLIPKVHSW